MFCDGVCEKKGKRCGLLYDVIMEHDGKIETITKCAFHHMLDSEIRQEQGQIRIQASVEESRNQKAEDDNKISHIVGLGMTGMMHAVMGDKEKFENALKLMSSEQLKLEK